MTFYCSTFFLFQFPKVYFSALNGVTSSARFFFGQIVAFFIGVGVVQNFGN